MTDTHNQLIELVGDKQGRIRLSITINEANIPTEQAEKLLLIVQEMQRESKGKAVTGADLQRKLLDIACKHKREKKGTTTQTTQKIHAAVTAQQELNKTTQKTVVIAGNTLKYEQRTITNTFIMDSVKPQPHGNAIRAYMEENKAALLEHHKWLLQDNGMQFENEEEAQQAIKGFNRRTARAHKRVINGEFEEN